MDGNWLMRLATYIKIIILLNTSIDQGTKPCFPHCCQTSSFPWLHSRHPHPDHQDSRSHALQKKQNHLHRCHHPYQVDNVDATLDLGVNDRLNPKEEEQNYRTGGHLQGNNVEGNNVEGNQDQTQDENNDHFHQEEMSEGSEVPINTTALSHHDDDDDDDDDHDDDGQVGEGEGSVVSSVTDKYGFLGGDILMLEVASSSSSSSTSSSSSSSSSSYQYWSSVY